MDEVETALTIWEKIDALDVPSLAVLTVAGFLWLRHSFISSLQSNQDAFVAAMHAIEIRLAGDRKELTHMADSLKQHTAEDRDEFRRLIDKMDETRQDTQETLNTILMEARAK